MTKQNTALIAVVIAGLLTISIRLIPYEHRLPNFAPAGALFLFVGAHLRPRLWALPFGLLAGIDLYFLGVNHWDPSPFAYAGYSVYLLLGWRLSRARSIAGIGVATMAGGVSFFLLTNFGVWLQHVLNPEVFVGAPFQFPPTLAGLVECYTAALPFFRGTLLGDLGFTTAFFCMPWLLSAPQSGHLPAANSAKLASDEAASRAAASKR